MRRRIFVAVLLPQNIRQDIDRARRLWIKGGLPIKWVETENIHITLGFFGAISDRTLVRISDALSNTASKVPAFTVRIGAPRIFSGRVILYSLAAPELRALQQALLTIPGKFSVPHLTLGRIKGQIQSRARMLSELSEMTGKTFTVDRIAIMESKLKPTGPLYTVVSEVRMESKHVLRSR